MVLWLSRVSGLCAVRVLRWQKTTPPEPLDHLTRIGVACNLQHGVFDIGGWFLPEPGLIQPESLHGRRTIDAGRIWSDKLIHPLRIQLIELRALSAWIDQPVFRDTGSFIFVKLVAAITPCAFE